MRIRNRKTYFTTLPEGSAPENKSKKISSVIYFLFLASIVLYILFYIGKSFLYVERKGIVEIERHLISSRVEGTVETIYAAKDDHVKYLQHLSKIRPAVGAVASFNNPSIIEDNNNISALGQQSLPAAITDKLLKLDNEIRLTDIKLRTAQSDYKLLKEESKLGVNEAFRNRLLELNNGAKIQPQMDSELNKAALRIQTLRAVKDSLRKYKADILKNAENSLNISPASGKSRIYFTGYEGLVQSPVNGIVHKVFKSVGAQVFPGDSLLSVRPVNGQIAVHGFFKADQVGYIKKGKTVVITFPDNTKSKGVIVNHYAAAETYKEKLLEDYIPVKPDILVEIIPDDTADAESWIRYDRMTVELRMKK